MSDDLFKILAPYYDQIMRRVRYERWEENLLKFQKLITPTVEKKIYHLDIACGTGNLMNRLSKYGWCSIGVDISPSMLYTGRQNYPNFTFLTANMCSLPFISTFHIASCLFDSINFLLDEDDIFRALCSISDVLLPQGILYFDCVTEQMVKQHYTDGQWKENYKDFKTVWESNFNEHTKIATLSILVQGQGWSVVRQKIYPVEIFVNAIQEAGLTLLACVDAHTWNYMDSGTVRVDFICAKQPSESLIKKFRELHQQLKDEYKIEFRTD
ncbi:MAG TPA: methyltransferase domain-containing protein [Candidatus Hydrogenedens sp.]|nr:methyltransferase domain-containing protein [Candidatus Hydrogenedens sp.]HPP58353.1 methyltransferase domain-containing protein [Candidatus Hydrogenedens sp.]